MIKFKIKKLRKGDTKNQRTRMTNKNFISQKVNFVKKNKILIGFYFLYINERKVFKLKKVFIL